MKKYLSLILIVFAFIPIVCFSQSNQFDNIGKAAKVYNGKLDFNTYSFIENQGQWDDKVLFMAKTKSMTVWITNEGMLFDQVRSKKTTQKIAHTENDVFENQPRFDRHVVGLEFVNPSVFKMNNIAQSKPSHKINYFIGNDRSKHISNARQYKELLFEDIYTGIDIRYYFDNGELRYDFIVAPGSNPALIEFNIKGSDNIYVSDNDLVIETSLEPIIQKDLIAYQNSKTDKIKSQFELNGANLKLKIFEYDRSKTLIIDPIVLVEYKGYTYGTIYDVFIDELGDIYFVGETRSFTVEESYGKYDAGYNGSKDILFGKLGVDDVNIEWASYLGGSSADISYSLAVQDNKIYIAGNTESSDFPKTDNALQLTKIGNTNMTLSVFDIGGDTLKYSTYYSNDNATSTDKYHCYTIGVNTNGNVYLGGFAVDTSGSGSRTPDFSDTNSIQTQTLGYFGFGILLGLVPDGNVDTLGYNWLFRSKFGANGSDVYSLDVDSDDTLYIYGHTHDLDTNFGLTTGAFDTTKNEERAIYFAKLHLDSVLTIDYNTIISDIIDHPFDWFSRILFDNGRVYIGASIRSTLLPVKNAFDSNATRRYSGFISVFEPNGENEDDLIYSSYFSTLDTNRESYIRDLDINCGKIVFTGSTYDSIHKNSLQPVNEYSGSPSEWNSNAIVGIVDITETGVNTLEKIWYSSDLNYKMGYSIKTPAIEGYSYVGGDYGISTGGKGSSFWLFETLVCDGVCPCPDSVDNWLDLTIEEGACEDSCQWQYTFNIPYPYNYIYKSAEITVKKNGNPINSHYIVQDSTLFSFGESESSCISSDTEITIRIILFCNDQFELDCVIEKTVICGCPCPPSKNEWLTIGIKKNSENCDSTQCYISHNWNIPPDYINCYTQYRYINEEDEVDTAGAITANSFSMYDDCLDPTGTYNAEVHLYKEDGTDTCKIDLHAYCNYKEHLYHCDDDCLSSRFIPDSLTYYSPCDTTCKVKVYYSWRDGCGNQDIYLEGFEIYKENNQDSTACLNCSMKDILRSATDTIIEGNKMNFKPWTYPYNPGSKCDTTWRVITSSCWTDWYKVPVTLESQSHQGSRSRVVTIYEQCDADCCVRGIQVCKTTDSLLNKSLSITDLGLIIGDTACTDITHSISYPDTLNGEPFEIDCIYSCDFYEDVDTSIVITPNGGEGNAKISVDERFEFDPDEALIEYRTSQSIDIFKISTRNARKIDRVLLTLYDMNGIEMDKIESEIAGHQQDFYFDISQYPSGTYVFSIVSEKGKVATGKFVIVK